MNQVLEINQSATLSASALLDASTSDSPLADVAAQIANVNASSAPALVSALVEHGGKLDFCLGGVLEVINDNDWFEGYESFGEFVRVTCGFDVRQAQHLMRTYRYLMDKGIQWSTVEALGWTKLRLLVNAKKLTAENAAGWVTRAAGKSMTVRALDNELKFVPEPPKPAAPQLAVVPSSSFTTSTPAPEPTGGGAGADEDVETESPDDEQQTQGMDPDESGDSHLLLKELMQSAGPDTVRELFAELFPDVALVQAGK